jgi:hypothetical protein
VQAILAINAAFTRQASPLAAHIVGDYTKAQQETNGYSQQPVSAHHAGDLAGVAACADKARKMQMTADNRSDNGVYHLLLHAGMQAVVGDAGNCPSGAAAAGGAVGGYVGQQFGKGLDEQEAHRRKLTGRE